MALFLNTSGFNYWIPKLISEAESELVIIVPYIQTSSNVINALIEANKKNVEITLIYRENKLTNEEKNKLLALDNLTLLHHPNIHCKTYFNGNLLIIGSMNLYEYSEKNNREMGILLNKVEHEELVSNSWHTSTDDKTVFVDANNEIKEIITGAHLEKISEKARKNSFEIKMLKNYEELEAEYCKKLNKYFLNKKFKPIQNSEHVWYSICNNFYDKVDVTFQGNRVSVKFNMDDDILKKLYDTWMVSYSEFEFKPFKYYWNYFSSDILVYQDNRYDWDADQNEHEKYNKTKEMLNSLINKYRAISGK